ncbi:MAG: chromosomal replication initiator protein DnaA [Phycisphaerae bacterium]|nr:chromosomal replication initiator protein DnaA [Phycisphaerae bacterium]
MAAPTSIMTEPDRQLWNGMLAQLRGSAAAICRQWFEEIEPMGLSGGVLSLRAHSSIHRDYLQRQCLGPFNDAARNVSGRLLSVRFLGPDDEARERAAAPSERAGTAAAGVSENGRGDGLPATAVETKPVPGHGVPASASREESPVTYAGGGGHDDSLPLSPDYGFENFVVGPSNRLAHAAALAIAANPGRAGYNPYFVHGGVGLGKTHLLQAVCLRITEAMPDASIYYTSCEGFMTQFMDAVAAGEMAKFRHKFRHVDVLVVDDIHFLAKRDRTQEEFFHTFNALYQAHKQIVLSSDAPPEEIPDLEERLVSRFKWGLVTSVGMPCYETRVEILKKKAAMRGIVLPDDAACHIAAKIDSNIRELEGAVVKLQVTAAVEKRPIDLALARHALGEREPSGGPEPRIQIQTIINAVTSFYGVKMTDLQSKRRQRSIALPRQLCMFLARRHTRFSLEEIGGYFGGRDHTTVMHAIRTIEHKREADAEFGAVVRSLEDTIRIPTVS